MSVNADTTESQPDASIPDFSTQDWLLVLEALATCAGPPPATVKVETADGVLSRPRSRRAWHLIEIVVTELGLQPDEIPAQIDDEWCGPSQSGESPTVDQTL